MIMMGTRLNVVDVSGIRIVSCIRILGSSYKRNAKLGDILIVLADY